MMQLHAAGYTTAVFTLHEDSGNDKITQGDLNICRLIPFAQFDGLIYAPYTFAHNGILCEPSKRKPVSRRASIENSLSDKLLRSLMVSVFM